MRRVGVVGVQKWFPVMTVEGGGANFDVLVEQLRPTLLKWQLAATAAQVAQAAAANEAKHPVEPVESEDDDIKVGAAQ
jgi:hypothetical protein